jgi:hypothetical protein
MTVDGVLTDVLDLTDNSVLSALGTDLQTRKPHTTVVYDAEPS